VARETPGLAASDLVGKIARNDAGNAPLEPQKLRDDTLS
jgi:hypothetical protein